MSVQNAKDCSLNAGTESRPAQDGYQATVNRVCPGMDAVGD
jgi:hypothetical protein